MSLKKRVLIVDDEPDVLGVLAEIVDSFGYDVAARADAESALAFVRSGQPVDLVLTDLSLPGMSGLDLLTEIKRLLPCVPVIMLTAHGSVETFIQTQSRGIFEYVNKPVRAAELRRILEVAMTASQGGADGRPTGHA